MENYNRVEKNDWGIYYYLNDKLHRTDGPAIEHSDRIKKWLQNGFIRKISGPVVKHSNGDKLWYYEGKWIDCNSQEEFEKLIKLKLFW